MRKLTKKQIVITASLSLLIIVLLLYPAYHSWTYDQELYANEQRMAQSDEKGGIMLASNDLKIDRIVATVQRTGGIPETDLTWLLDFLNKNNGPGQKQEIARVSILSPLEELKNIPPSQKERIYQSVIPLLGDDASYNDELDKIRASTVMGVLRDKRAIPYLVPLLSADSANHSGQLHLHVQRALHAIGYQSN